MKKLIIISSIYLALLTTASFAKELIYSFPTIKQERQFINLIKDLRCVVCQNQSLAESNADLAKDLRAKIYELIKANNSDQEIIHFLTSRYGDFILLKPPIKAVTIILWGAPILFLLGSLLVFSFLLKKRTKRFI